MIKGGYTGKILRVDLSKQKVEDEPLPGENILRRYVGGTGLASKYLFDEVAPSVRPLDPENRLIFMTGPLSGTMWPCSSRHCIVTIDAEFPKIAANTWGGGFWAAKLRWTGYDGIIVQGKSSELVYLSIQNGKAELRDAGHLRGKETRETEDLLRKELRDNQASVVCVGPAGERCLPASAICNDASHVAAGCGTGEVMGSKLLKAIAISGRGTAVPLADAKKFAELALEYRKLLRQSGTWRKLGNGGLVRHYKEYAHTGRIPFKNGSDPMGTYAWGQEMKDTLDASEVIPRPCFNCPIGCGQEIIVGKGPHKGYRSRGGGGGQNEFGAQIGVMEGGSVIYLTDLLSRLGINAQSMCMKMGLLFECYERGLISKEFTDGLELNWGNADAAEKLLRKFVNQEGLGKFMAQDAKEMARAVGGGADQFMGGFKGTGYHHDPRPHWDNMLGHAVATNLAMEGRGIDMRGGDPDLGFPDEIPKLFNRERAPIAVRLTQIKNRWDNVLGVCFFGTIGIPGNLNHYLPMALNLAVGWDFDREEAMRLGERITNEARVFNVTRGLTPEDDLDVGPRWLDGFHAGPYKDNPLRPHFKWMVKEYYRIMGWDPDTGIPSEDTLKRVGLDELIEEVRKLRPRPVETLAGPKRRQQKNR